MSRRSRLPLIASGLVATSLLLFSISSDVTSAGPETRQFADRSAGTYLWVNTGDDPEGAGTFLFVAGDGTLYWGAGPATLTTAGGTTSLEYTGEGWRNADGDFDPLTWHVDFGPTILAAELTFSAVLEADGQATAQLTVDSVVHQLDTARVTSGADAVLAQVIGRIKAADWAAVHGLLHPRLKDAWTQADFVSTMTAGTAQEGAVANASLVSGPTYATTDLGWDLAESVIAVTMIDGGTRIAYETSLDLVHDGSWMIGQIGSIDPEAWAEGSTPVTIDIRPNVNPNTVSCGSNGVIPVAVISSATVDATHLDPDDARFGRLGDEARETHVENGHAALHLTDVNQDGRMDALFHFRRADTGLTCADMGGAGSAAWTVRFTGTLDGSPVAGTGTIQLTN